MIILLERKLETARLELEEDGVMERKGKKREGREEEQQGYLETRGMTEGGELKYTSWRKEGAQCLKL